MKVTLKKAHRHDDVPHAAGDQIDVSKQEAEWLQAHQVIDDASLRAAAAKPDSKPSA